MHEFEISSSTACSWSEAGIQKCRENCGFKIVGPQALYLMLKILSLNSERLLKNNYIVRLECSKSLRETVSLDKMEWIDLNGNNKYFLINLI